MKEAKENRVNRCFEECPRDSDRQKEKKVKMILLATAEKKKANKEIASLLSQFKDRYSILQLLPLIKRRYPSLLTFAIERVECQRSRNELSIEGIVEFETFKASLEQKE
ncbi:MAG: hypothetical protein Q8O66_00200 [bacterium]|nr:hypothetical protein [bacterium]